MDFSRPSVILFCPDSDIREYVSCLLPNLGNYCLEEAETEIALLAKIHALSPCLIILDADRFRTAPSKAKELIAQCRVKTPFLILASPGLELPLTEALKDVAPADVALKPPDFSQLSDKIKAMLPQPAALLPEKEYAKLLIADDETDVAELLSDMFEALGIEVHIASDGKEALRIFQQESCNLAILDLRMPNLGGEEVAKLFEASGRPPKAVLFVTAALGSTLTEVRRLGHPVLPKPMDLGTIEKHILGVCKRFHLSLRD